MIIETIKTLDAIIQEATLNLFDVSGVHLVPVQELPDGHDHTFAAAIGFVHPHMPGMLILTMDRGLAVQSRPAELRGYTPSEKDLDDWVGELSNQLIGRIKNQLFRHGIDIKLSIPSVIRGSLLCRGSVDASVSQKLRFVHAAGSLSVYFDVKVPKGLELKVLTGEFDCIPEGEVALF
jgi:CheY-specific phosphatase CheX